MAVHAESNIQLNTIPAQTSLLGGHFVYFQGNTSSGGNTPASANVIADSRYLSIPAQWGYNTHIGANGIKLRYNETTLSEWKTDRLTFYKPGTNNPSLELISGINTALNIYNPTNNTKTLGLDTSGLNFYGTSTSAPDVTLNADGLTLINGSIRGGIVGQDEFLYLSPQVFADEYEEYVLSEDTEVDETKVYYIRSGEEGEYIYTEVSEPTGNPQENEYYEIAHAPGTIPIDNYVKDNWRQIIGRKFAVDTDGNLYANGLNANNAHLQQAEVEGAIIATSLTIGSGSDAYDGAAAINISGYDIEIEKNGTDEVEGVSVYLYPILYHNGVQVPTIEVDYSHFIWYQDDETIGTIGDSSHYGRILAFYGHTYRVTYDFDDGAVGGGTEIQTREVDPSKYITKTGDTSITVHPEIWQNQASYISLSSTSLDIYNANNESIAQYGSSIRVGKSDSNHLEILNDGIYINDDNNITTASFLANNIILGNNSLGSTLELTSTSLNLVDNLFPLISANITGETPYVGGAMRYIGEVSYGRTKTFPLLADARTRTIAMFKEDADKVFLDGVETTLVNPSYRRVATYFDLTLANGQYLDRYRFGWTTTGSIHINYDGHFELLDLSYDANSSTVTVTVDHLGKSVIVSGRYNAASRDASYSFGSSFAGNTCFAEGRYGAASGTAAHVEGEQNLALGIGSHAEGWSTEASGNSSHSEGWSTIAMGTESHAEGAQTYAEKSSDHAEGANTKACGGYSHAQNYYTIAASLNQTSLGKYNEEDNLNIYSVIIGNGTADDARSNALTVDWSGNVSIAGTLTQSSDRRLKDHISYLGTDAVNFIQNLKPAYYMKDNKPHVGFYAQDVESIDQWKCMVGEMNGFKTLGYTEIIAPLVKYCQKLEERITTLEQEVNQ